jgi:hypothetical protein
MKSTQADPLLSVGYTKEVLVIPQVAAIGAVALATRQPHLFSMIQTERLTWLMAGMSVIKLNAEKAYNTVVKIGYVVGNATATTQDGLFLS